MKKLSQTDVRLIVALIRDKARVDVTDDEEFIIITLKIPKKDYK